MAAHSDNDPSVSNRDDGQDPAETPADIAGYIRDFNKSNPAHEELWTRVHQAGDAHRQAVLDLKSARGRAHQAQGTYLAVQAVYPHRRAALPIQVLIAAFSISLDAVACWFAAQALGGGQIETIAWTALFLAVLAFGEVGLDHYSEHGGQPWRTVAAALVIFVTGMGVLRFLYLATVGTVGLSTALVGAALFTAATTGFLVIGYRALRTAETFATWQTRRSARRAERERAAADRRMQRLGRERGRLAVAYASRIRPDLLSWCPPGQLAQAEVALRRHLTGE